MTTEIVSVSADEGVQQGTVLEMMSEQKERSWAIVVTADCDIAKWKFGSHLTCARVLSAADYIRHVVGPKKLREVAKNKRGEAVDSVRKAIKDKSGPSAVPSDDAVEHALSQYQTAIAPLFDDSVRVAALVSLIEAVLEVESMTTAPPLEDQVALYSLLSGFDSVTSKRKILQSVSPDSLPGDAFFLSALPNGSEGGFIVYLRGLLEMRPDDIAFRAGEARQRRFKAKAVGRLDAPYRYRLTQMLAAVFSDIGLPSEYETRRKQAIDLLTQRSAAK